MIKLSDRLKAIANEVRKGETIADIGTDHGFLPFFLLQQETSPDAILCDISKGSLAKAMKLGKDDDRMKFRLGDGLCVLDDGEVDTVVIAGLGAARIIDIMRFDEDHSKSFKRFIIQPRKDPGELRYFLLESGYDIEKEKLVREGKFICEIIVAAPKSSGDDIHLIPNDPCAIEWEVPWYYLDMDDELAKEYVKRKLDREKRILSAKERNSTPDSEKADIERTRTNIDYLKTVMERMK